MVIFQISLKAKDIQVTVPLVIPCQLYFLSISDSEFKAFITLFLPEEVPSFLAGKFC